MRTSLVALAALLFALPAQAQMEGRIVRGPDSVRVNSYGLITRTPVRGLSTLGGPMLLLEGACAEWFGVEYTIAGQAHEAVGSGNEPDWAGRPRVELVSFWWNGERAVSRTRHGVLEIETEISWDPDGPSLLGHATFTNLGSETIDTVFYTREWRKVGEAGWSFPPDFEMRQARDQDVARLIWMTNPIPPGAKRGVRFSYQPGELQPVVGEVEVPLRRWTNEDWPTGLGFGRTNGISFGDYDADGWVDIFAFMSARLYRNVNGETWQLAARLNPILPNSTNRYGSSFGDYNNDGLPDIGTEPRTGFGDQFFHLLKNLGDGPNFVDVAGDPDIVDVQPFGPSETICWGDVDDDADLDMFLPVYPPSVGGPGNFFLDNLGPVGPGGEYVFAETSGPAGLNNPPGAARPEGAQFVDVDFDGDMDLYCNGTLYQNVSVETPLFTDVTRNAGIRFRGQLDEGAALFDYDLDGDFDLVIVYSNPGVMIWENRGDGTFFRALDLIESPFIGLDLGMSAADWDNDGDIDFSTRNVFRRNMLVETGERGFTVATNMFNPSHVNSATPAWGDWDKDGDLDCAMGNWMSTGRLFHNITYDETTPEDEKPYVRVRVVRDSAEVERGLETLYASNVEIVVAGDPIELRRKKTISSAGGYLNQNDYTLHFAIPRESEVERAAADLVFDVIVDLPGRPDRGILRIDKHVNPALGGIHLASLEDREIVVYRSGRVILDGEDLAPVVSQKEARLRTTSNGLARPSAERAISAPMVAPDGERWVGIELGTSPFFGPAFVKELLLDGQAGELVDCAGDGFNFAVWDVTDAATPILVEAMALRTSDRNDRSYFHTEIVLQPARIYRLVALVTELRATPIPGPSYQEPVKLRGGVSFVDTDPCSGVAVVAAELDTHSAFLAVRHVRMTPAPTIEVEPIGAGGNSGAQRANRGKSRP